MQYYYVDSSVSTSGTGTIDSPFKQLTDVMALTTLTHPVTIKVKRGCVYDGLVKDVNNLFYNTTSQMSYIEPYGNGENPVISDGIADGYCLVIPKARNLTIRYIDMTSPMFANAMASINPCSYNNDAAANVWLEHCNFIGLNNTTQAWKVALWLTASSDNTGRVGYFGLRFCKFQDTARGVWVMGNSSLPSTATDNTGDLYYGYGIRIEDCSFINIPGDGCIMSNAASKINPLVSISDTDTSGIFRCTYRSFASDKVSNASVAFWLSNCSKVVMDHLLVDSTIGSVGGCDKTAYDFDILCHDCLLQYSISKNNTGFIITSNYASQVTAPGSSETVYDWYYTKGYGNSNNLARYCLSFNDGCFPGSEKILWQGFTFNLTFQNCTFIDTVTTNAVLVQMYKDSGSSYTLTNNVYGIILDSCNFYCPNATSIRLLSTGANSGTDSLIKTINCNVYSASGITPTYPTNGSYTKNISTDPLFTLLPASSPGTIEKAWMMKMSTTSPLIGTGTSTTVPDLNGNAGSTIGHVQY